VYADEFYDDAATWSGAQILDVTFEELLTNVDAVLSLAGRIRGRVVNNMDEGLPDIVVSAYGADGQWLRDVTTNAAGEYDIGGFSTGTFKLGFSDPSNSYAPEFFDDQSALASAHGISVTRGVLTDLSDVELEVAGKISGTVTDSTGWPSGPCVSAYTIDGRWVADVNTAADGRFMFAALKPGSYCIRFWDGGEALPEEWYDNKDERVAADPVVVEGGSTTSGIDATVLTPYDILSLTSPTHPSPVQWYASHDPGFLWSADSMTACGYSWAFDRFPDTVPDEVSDGNLPSASFVGVADGVWYFHVRAMDDGGFWGATKVAKVQIDSAPPSVSSLTCTTHPDADSWYTSGDPSFRWVPSDSAAPVDGYSYLLDQAQATEPDTFSEGTASSKSYAGIADGVYYFHLRARDAAGNWGSVVHRRIQIDSTPPSIVSLSSTTHLAADAWSSNNEPVFTWSPAADLSGVVGYSWEMSRTPSAVPDAAIDGVTTRASYAGLADGVWYFHVRACDGSGAWGPPLRPAFGSMPLHPSRGPSRRGSGTAGP
jgi:hypothetical protein